MPPDHPRRSTSPKKELPPCSKSGYGPVATTTNKLSSVERFREEGYTLMQSVGHLQPTSSRSSDPTLPSPESPMDVSKTLKRLSRFNSDQMEHLIDMLRMTIATHPELRMGNGSIQEQLAVTVPAAMIPAPPRPPKATQSNLAISNALESASLAKIKPQERPSQLSLSTERVN